MTADDILLNTVYKIGSGVIASRLKRVLEKLIDLDQTVFISGRYIGDNIRLIYDMLQFTEENDIPGLLLLIDFEKAFDSISWNFLLSVLKFFNFGESIINWGHLQTVITYVQSLSHLYHQYFYYPVS
jgi:hypothetical protein